MGRLAALLLMSFVCLSGSTLCGACGGGNPAADNPYPILKPERKKSLEPNISDSSSG